MSSRACPREKIYFVVNEKHLFKKWPELVSEPRPFAPDECPERIISGRDCWIILTWARLCAVDCPFDPVLSCRAVDNAVCVFHWDDATPAQGVHRFVNRFQGEWHDYQHVDAVLAIRDCPPVVLATKPASKLINAWKAGVPALLGPEPAYRELRTSPLDFLEAASAEAVLDSIDRLQQESGLYRRMTEHGAKRAQAFDVNMLTQKWISLLEEARERNRRETLHPVMRSIRYLWNRQKINLGKRLSGWRD